MATTDPSADGSASHEGIDPRLLPGVFVLPETVSQQKIAAYEEALASASSEATMQRFLQVNPWLLTQHLGASPGRWVIPKTRLGAEYETDFLIAEIGSSGFVWYAIELERPQAKLFTKKGNPSEALTHALRQISDWRNWLSFNRDYAMRPNGQSGLGLLDIDPELEGLIIMGRDHELDPQTNQLRRRLSREHRIKIETYDWLSHQARALLSPEKPAKRAARKVFGSISSDWLDMATRVIEWESVVFKFDSGSNDAYVPVNFVDREKRDWPLSLQDWEDWTEHVNRDIGDGYSLLISERPPDEALRGKLTEKSAGIWYAPQWWRIGRHAPEFCRVDVLAYLPPSSDQSDRISRLSVAQELLLHYLPQPDHVPDEGHVKKSPWQSMLFDHDPA
jgi:Domain of unknown function (DUF4263)